MASNSIKVYNDTVLKQSILQGFQTQRTNENLGRFTMGELAFTRDTGRLFVGNYTNASKPLDSSYVKGGILSGNKYLGMIDSKPLIHFSASGSTGWKPLSYFENTQDENVGTEYALFGENSKYRKDDANGWNKEATYIDKYGVYSGDYVYDIYENALIIFDKNITTNASEQPLRKIVKSSNGKVEEIYLDKSSGEEISIQNQTRRTPLYNITEEPNLNERPIYGDGYVVMRLLEPDGKTIGYKDRTFKYSDANYNEDGSPLPNDNNWSHNLLEVKEVPASTLKASFNERQFHVVNDKMTLNPVLPNITELSGNKLTLPSTVQFKNSISLKFNGTQVSNNSYKSDKILALYGSNGSYEVKLCEQFIPSYTIKLNDGLINTQTGESIIVLSQEASDNNELSIGFTKKVDTSLTSSIGYSNPFDLDTPSQYYYVGTGHYNDGGCLIKAEQYDITTYNAAITHLNKFDTKNNSALVMVKNPLPICWNTPTESLKTSTSSAILEFVCAPDVFCIKKTYTTDEEEPKQQTGEIDKEAYKRNITVLGNNNYEDVSTPSEFPLIDGVSYPPENRELFQKIKNSEYSINIPVSQQLVEFDVPSLDPYDENEKQLIQNGYNVYIYFGDEYGDSVYEKDGKFYKKEDDSYVLIPTPSDDMISPQIQKIEYKLNNIIDNIDSTIWDEVQYPKPATTVTPHDEYPDALLSIINTDGILHDNTLAPGTINISDYMDTDKDELVKIEINTNDKTDDDGFVLFFDASVNYDVDYENDEPVGKLYHPSSITTLECKVDDYAQLVYNLLYNSEVFTGVNYAPSFLKITYLKKDLELGKNIETVVYVKIPNITYSEVQPEAPEVHVPSTHPSGTPTNIPPTHIHKAFGFKQDDTRVDITEQLQNSDGSHNYYNPSTHKFIMEDINAQNFKGVAFLVYKPAVELFQMSDVLFNTDGVTYYQFTIDNNFPTAVQSVTYRATGVLSDTDDNFVIKSIVMKDGSTYDWSSSSGKSKIKECIDNGDITIPKTFSADIIVPTWTAFQFKSVPSNGVGYFIPKEGLATIDANKLRIPKHANSVLLEVNRMVANPDSATPISIYTTGQYTDDDITSLKSNNNEYSFPFVISSDSISMPTLSSTIPFLPNEKIIYHSTSEGSQIIEVPLYKTMLNDNKGFTIRLHNVDCGYETDNKFVIRLIGYRV